MAESQRFLLRILAGPNAGAEAVLTPRTVVGSAESADIMIGDAALAPEHFTIVLEGGAVNLVLGEASVTLKGEAQSNGTFRLAPYDLIKFGTTTCAIGPEDGAWPSFASADLLPAPPPTTPASPAEAQPATQPVPAEPMAAPVLEKRLVRPARSQPRRAIVLVGAFLVVLLLAGASYWLIEDTREAEAAKASETTAQEIVAGLGAKDVKIRQERHGVLVAEGYVATNELQRRLRQALLDANLPIKFRAVSLEQQVSAVRTIVSAAGVNLNVEAEEATGKIVISGFVPQMSVFDGLQTVLQRDIADLRPIDAHVVTPEQVVEEAKQRLAAEGLASVTKVEVTNKAVRITGALPSAGQEAVRKIANELNTRWSRTVKVEDATTLVSAAAPVPIQTPVSVRSTLPRDRFPVVVAGKDGFVRDSFGRRYGVGDKLANGEVIEDIGVNEIVTTKNGITYRYTFGGGQ